jgi:predicted nucleotidyltransferase
LRLTREEVDCLIQATHKCFGETAEIWLFGSRVDDRKKGGDIDLYIETDMSTGIVAAKLEMQSLIWSTFGNQKIDILIHSKSRKPSPIHEIAKSTGQKLSTL